MFGRPELKVTNENRDSVVIALRSFIGKPHDIYIKSKRLGAKSGAIGCNYPIRAIEDDIITMRWENFEYKLLVSEMTDVAFFRV